MRADLLVSLGAAGVLGWALERDLWWLAAFFTGVLLIHVVPVWRYLTEAHRSTLEQAGEDVLAEAIHEASMSNGGRRAAERGPE